MTYSPRRKTILAWHFLPADRRLLHGDGREVKVGETVKFTGNLKLCKSGLHASKDPWAALQYAPGPIICRVRCGGKVLQDTDKLVCTERTVLWMADATAMLREFARLCALDVIHLWDAPEVVKEYLKTGDENKRAAARGAGWAAWDSTWAAWDAAWAAWDSTRAAAWDAARAATMAATRAAARDAAWDAAMAATRDAAWAAAEKKQQARFKKMALALRRKSA